MVPGSAALDAEGAGSASAGLSMGSRAAVVADGDAEAADEGVDGASGDAAEHATSPEVTADRATRRERRTLEA